MTLSQTAEYALRAAVWLAQHQGEPQTTQQIADGTKVSVSYLPKVLKPLARAGILTSQRGVNGGYSLDRKSADVSVLDVVACVDTVQRIRRCPLGISGHADALCALHAFLDASLAESERRFRDASIESLVRPQDGPAPLDFKFHAFRICQVNDLPFCSVINGGRDASLPILVLGGDAIKN